MENTKRFLEEGMPGAISFEAYYALTEELVTKGATTGENQSELYLHFTKLNHHRMKRLVKTVKLIPELEEIILSIDKPMNWLILTEAWCGDAAQNVPLMDAMAKLNPNIMLSLILRDEHTDIMDEFLTKGGRSIPKLIATDADHNLLFDWGPRPAPVQEMVHQYRDLPEPKKPYIEFAEEVQKWYLIDKTQTFQSEFLALLRRAVVEGSISK